ncbi:MAG: alpha/beta fold hydrolase [Usitatibacter sp.]
MLARLVQVSLLLELATYVVIGAWLHASRDWPWIAIVFAALAMLFGARLVLVCFTCFLGWLWRSPRTAADSIRLIDVPRYLVGEYGALVTDNLLQLPFERWMVRRNLPATPAQGLPIVLVHGYLSNRGYFRPLVRFLESAGAGPLFAPNFPVVFSSIEDFAAELHEAIERIAAGCGQGKVVLVCHSMGGLAAREYLRVHGIGRVHRLVTIASPHHGTMLATFGMGLNARQMRRGSDFLRRLEAEEARVTSKVPTTSIYSPHDNLVSPQDTSRLDWARNITVPGKGHLALLSAARTFELLREALDLPARPR